MRAALLLIVLAANLMFAAGCPAPSPTTGPDLAVVESPRDLAVASPDLATVSPGPDLAVARDIAMGGAASDLGSIGDPCVSACGCQQGMTCVSGKCQPTPALIYCCDRPLCPKGAYCQLPDGGPSQCP